ncbi:MAG: response regulator [Anaerolineaceae bacterium]|jgi:two-component system cell cycle response regulator DivK|nr:response regulator [Anaerolineaceae bacterium]
MDNSDLSVGKSETNNPSPIVILVVEDNIGNFKLIARLLGSLGVQCEWKTSGYEVVEFARNLEKIDLVLMDIRLPYEDGYEAMRKIRQSRQFDNIPIVAVTAVAGPEQMKTARLAGFDGFIGKPLDPDRFPEQIKQILAGKAVWEYN